MDTFQAAVIDDRARDMIVRMCLSGKGQWVLMHHALRDAGFIDPSTPVTSGWCLYRYVYPMVRTGETQFNS
jgi:hypothetical protein